jgi:hypothetical protein
MIRDWHDGKAVTLASTLPAMLVKTALTSAQRDTLAADFS